MVKNIHKGRPRSKIIEKRAQHTSGLEKVSKMEVQSVRSVGN